MPRTTLNIDKPILDEVKELCRREGKSLGRMVSELLADVMQRPPRRRGKTARFRLITKRMGRPLVDLEDKEALWRVLDRKILRDLARRRGVELRR